MAQAPRRAAAEGPAWLLVDDACGVAQAAAAALADRGRQAIRVRPATTFGRTDDGDFTAPLNRAGLESVLARLQDEGVELDGVAYLAAMDATAPDQGRCDPNQQLGPGGVVATIQALAARSLAPRLMLVTCGAQPVEQPAVEPGQATVWGMAKVIDLEHPDLRCRRVDLDRAADREQRGRELAAELLRDDEERLVALRGGRRHVGRLQRADLSAATSLLEQHALAPRREAAVEPIDGSPQRMRLVQPGTGVLDDLRFESAARAVPGPGEVEIEVRASGLSFRDVMNALAMRDDPDPLGAECAGRVVALGDDVEGLQVGDAVVAMTAGAFDSHVTVSAELVAPKPARLTFEQAATVPTAFTTAWFALRDAGKLQPGESVLIHAGAGGVGMAAVQIALAIGARVLATAGSAAKRAYLESLGVEAVFDSRSVDFRDGVLQATDGRGVDLLLNALSGPFIEASVHALAPQGRFLEIGKRDLWTHEQFAAVRPQGRYEIIDLAARTVESPSMMRGLLDTVFGELAAGRLRPLPLTLFDNDDVAEAFRYMSQARQIGKIVVRRMEGRGLPIRDDGSYLITGGLKGLGLLTAEWLADRGAKALALLSRSAPDEAARQAITRLEARGLQVLSLVADVADESALRDAIERIDRELPPLAGLFHSAGVLADSVLVNQSWERFEQVFAAKVEGAWNLHRLLGDRPLDCFVLYSSTSALLGAAGQANHAAANGFLDALAWMRRGRGLSGQSINWGVWSEIGSAASRGADERIVAQGANPIAPDQGLAALERVLLDGRPQLAVVPIHWDRFLDNFVGEGRHPWWDGLRPAKELPGAAPSWGEGDAEVDSIDEAAEAVAADAWLEQLRAAPTQQRRGLLVDRICEDVVKVIGLDPSLDVDPRQPLSEMGLDSLMAVELRNLMGTTFPSEQGLPATLVFDYPTIDSLADFLMPRLSIDEPTLAAPEPSETPSAAAESTPTDESEDLLSAIEQMSDDEVDQIFKD